MDIQIVRWAADECERQQSGEQSVARLCEAWLYLSRRNNNNITPELVITLGKFVDPENAKGYRTLPVYFKSGDFISASNISHQIRSLCEYSHRLTPLQWYTEFEKIHPFGDGNGRVGSLLFNFLSNTLLNPVVPPDVFTNQSPPCV